MSWLRAGMHRAAQALQRISPRAWFWIGYAGFLIYAFPGYMSNDSAIQLVEGRSGIRRDPHPPIMAWEWSWLDRIVTGPTLMMLLQGAVFLLGTAALLRRAMSPRVAGAAAAGILWFPPVLTVMAVIWKDSQMAAFLIGGAALVISERRDQRLLGLAVLSLGCAFRYNALAATVPLVFALFAWRPGMRWLQRYAISLVAASLVVGASFGLNRALTVEHAILAPASADIVGVLAFTRDRTDDDLREVLRDMPLHVTTDIQATARRVYSPRNMFWIDHGDDRMFDPITNDVQLAASLRAWKAIVASDLRAYFEYRLTGFCELIGYTDNGPWAPAWAMFLEIPNAQLQYLDHAASPSELQSLLAQTFFWFAYETPLYRPYIFIAIALLLLVVACRDRLSFALLGSGLCYQLSFFAVSGTPDYRYSHWMVTTTCVALALLFAQRLRRIRISTP